MYTFKSTDAHASDVWLCIMQDTALSWIFFLLKPPWDQDDTGGQVDV